MYRLQWPDKYLVSRRINNVQLYKRFQIEFTWILHEILAKRHSLKIGAFKNICLQCSSSSIFCGFFLVLIIKVSIPRMILLGYAKNAACSHLPLPGIASLFVSMRGKNSFNRAHKYLNTFSGQDAWRQINYYDFFFLVNVRIASIVGGEIVEM